MSWQEVFTCDSCGKQKGEVNHRFMVNDFESFMVLPFNDRLAKYYKSACGRECLNKMLNAWLEGK